ncbi:hypothetical protein COL154_004008 [Colletotrichum chrysophilum]|nr:hypothetical protein COL154_004008 [Colletotrichum chrysophilum]
MSVNHFSDLVPDVFMASTPTEKPIHYIVAGFLLLLVFYTVAGYDQSLPEVNPRKALEVTNRRRMNDFIHNGKQLMIQAKATFGKNPYRVLSEWGSLVVLPADYLPELRNDPRLDFMAPSNDDGHGYIPGFDPFTAKEGHPQMVTKYLTKALTKLTKPISDEATIVLRQVMTDATDWHDFVPREEIIQIVSRLSTRVFMGEELCRDEEWLRACADYTVTAFGVGYQLGQYPRWSRPLIHWFLPSCWEVRRLLSHARQVLKPHIEKRNAKKAQAVASGDTTATFDDAIEWFSQIFKDNYDPATQQITLSLVAIHTTSDLLQQTMVDLAQHPELFQPLREELVRVLGTEGLKKSALNNLKLMDSVLKESQRLKPALLCTWRRLATENIELSSGFVIRKGQRVIINNTHMWDDEWYDSPEQYDGYRFLRMRNTDEEKHAHLVSASPKHTAFGYGQHACPGRFFAANELKIALAHLLLKYDWKLADETRDPTPVPFGMALLPDPNVKFLIRRRKEEIDLNLLEC